MATPSGEEPWPMFNSGIKHVLLIVSRRCNTSEWRVLLWRRDFHLYSECASSNSDILVITDTDTHSQLSIHRNIHSCTNVKSEGRPLRVFVYCLDPGGLPLNGLVPCFKWNTSRNVKRHFVKKGTTLSTVNI